MAPFQQAGIDKMRETAREHGRSDAEIILLRGVGQVAASADRWRVVRLRTKRYVIVGTLWRGGYRGSTLDQVAAALGVTKPTLCRTLGDKEAIFTAASMPSTATQIGTR